MTVTATPFCSWSNRRAVARATRGSGPVSTGPSARRRASPTVPDPSRADFRALARNHSVVPVWREVLADLITPVAAFLRLVGDEPGFLLESVEHGERWSRFSFIGCRPSATIVARRGRLEVDGPLPDGTPRSRCPGGAGRDPRRLPFPFAARASPAARGHRRVPGL
ncbi:MAG: hypothetical protein ACYDAD_03380 [Acidimicrobiales bacterium]